MVPRWPVVVPFDRPWWLARPQVRPRWWYGRCSRLLLVSSVGPVPLQSFGVMRNPPLDSTTYLVRVRVGVRVRLRLRLGLG